MKKVNQQIGLSTGENHLLLFIMQISFMLIESCISGLVLL